MLLAKIWVRSRLKGPSHLEQNSMSKADMAFIHREWITVGELVQSTQNQTCKFMELGRFFSVLMDLEGSLKASKPCWAISSMSYWEWENWKFLVWLLDVIGITNQDLRSIRSNTARHTSHFHSLCCLLHKWLVSAACPISGIWIPANLFLFDTSPFTISWFWFLYVGSGWLESQIFHGKTHMGGYSESRK